LWRVHTHVHTWRTRTGGPAPRSSRVRPKPRLPTVAGDRAVARHKHQNAGMAALGQDLDGRQAPVRRHACIYASCVHSRHIQPESSTHFVRATRTYRTRYVRSKAVCITCTLVRATCTYMCNVRRKYGPCAVIVVCAHMCTYLTYPDGGPCPSDQSGSAQAKTPDSPEGRGGGTPQAATSRVDLHRRQNIIIHTSCDMRAMRENTVGCADIEVLVLLGGGPCPSE
jgi:hypothetical protein